MPRGLLLVALLIPVLAVAKPAEPPLQASIPFQVQQEKVRADLQGDEVYREISSADRGRVIEALERMSLAIGDGTADALSAEKKVAVFNDQELVNGILTKARDDSRLVCKREKRVGSQMTSTSCLTVAERNRMRRESEQNLRQAQDGKLIKRNE
ncbi:MAG TPA: hypothetical protein VF513_03540 [Stenotrophomonas sp.]